MKNATIWKWIHGISTIAIIAEIFNIILFKGTLDKIDQIILLAYIAYLWYTYYRSEIE